jgi:aminopeptidase Y
VTIVALLLVACAGPSLTASPSASPTGSASYPPAREIAPGDIAAHLDALEEIAADNNGLRTAGTPGYEASAEYVADQLRTMGYAVETPPFEMATFDELPGSVIEVEGGPVFAAPIDFKAMIYSASGDLDATVTQVGYGEDEVGGCAASDFDAFVAGSIALVEPGGLCYRRDIVDNAVAAGATALVVAPTPQYSGAEPRRPTLLYPDGIDIPVLSVGGEAAVALQAASEAGTSVHISVTTVIGQAQVQNVIAESESASASAGSGEKVVMLGGHLDGVHDGPGINDNGSGSAALLEIARLLAEDYPQVRVRFAFWGGEEFGLLGSRAWVNDLGETPRDDIAAYLNFDMIGSPNWIPIVYDDSDAAPGSSAITDFFEAWLIAHGITPERHDLGGGSDHAFFAQAGIPTGGLFSGATEIKTDEQAAAYGGTAGVVADACYHLACDTADNVDTELVATFADAVVAFTLALSRGELTLE